MTSSMKSTTNETQLFHDFVLRGFFSEYLPPCFNLKKADSEILFNQKISCSFDDVPPYRYTMSRFTEDGKRRMIFMVHPVNAYLVEQE